MIEALIKIVNNNLKIQMKKLLLTLIIFSFFFACEKDEDVVKEIDTTLLSGNWYLVKQYKNDYLFQYYSQIHECINIDNGETLWVDTIKFGATTFYFSEYNNQSVFNSFNLKSENVRDLFGIWYFTENKNEIRIQSAATEYMTEDTIINEHSYSFFNFLNFEFEISEVTETSLELTKGSQKLIFERIF